MDKSIIGFCGYPDPSLINMLKVQYPNATWIDLDVELSFVADYKILPQVISLLHYSQALKRSDLTFVRIISTSLYTVLQEYICDGFTNPSFTA